MTDPAGPESTVEAGKKIPIRASAKGATKYEWQFQGDGNISATTGDAILYTAPEGGGIAILTVTAYNDQGASAPSSLTIRVPPPPAMASVPLGALAIPAGWMSGGGDPARYISLGSALGHRPDSKSSMITYKTGGSWGGWFWWPLTCGDTGTAEAWDKVKRGACGINVLEQGDLSAVNRLTFWAKGDQGGEAIEFKIGAVDILPSPGRSLGKVTLTGDWKQYEIDLSGMNLTNAIALFYWGATDMDNPKGAVFYLDDIQFEGPKKQTH